MAAVAKNPVTFGQHLCANCHVSCWNADLKRCSRCRTAYYCSRECQKENWSFHKGLCAHEQAMAGILAKGNMADWEIAYVENKRTELFQMLPWLLWEAKKKAVVPGMMTLDDRGIKRSLGIFLANRMEEIDMFELMDGTFDHFTPMEINNLPVPKEDKDIAMFHSSYFAYPDYLVTGINLKPVTMVSLTKGMEQRHRFFSFVVDVPEELKGFTGKVDLMFRWGVVKNPAFKKFLAEQQAVPGQRNYEELKKQVIDYKADQQKVDWTETFVQAMMDAWDEASDTDPEIPSEDEAEEK